MKPDTFDFKSLPVFLLQLIPTPPSYHFSSHDYKL